jgi:putative ABC transport system permease protein
MSWLSRLVNTLRTSRVDRDLEEELGFHHEERTRDLLRQGLDRDVATAQAFRERGVLLRHREASREIKVLPWLESVKQDLGYAFRAVRRTPGFTAVAVATLALGIGANTAIFSVVHAILLRPLPYPDSDRLVRIVENVPATDGSSVPQARAVGVTLSDLASFRAQATTLSHVGIHVPSTMIMTGRGEPVRVEGGRLSPAVLAMLGVRAAMGRIFEPHEEDAGSDAVVVLSHALWERSFARDADVLQQSLTLDGRSYSVVGVMPPGFEFPDAQTQLWVPFALGGFALRARIPPLARLADGVSIETAAAQVSSILPHLTTTMELPRSGPPRFDLVRLQEQLVAPVRPALTILAAAVGFVLLIACVNVANLALARTSARQREIAIRTALGASRSRLVRQLLTESILLALIGGLAGTGLAFGGIRLLQRLAAVLPRRDMLPDLGIPRLGEIEIDVAVLGFTLMVSLLTGLVAGVAPAIRQSRSRDSDVLRQGAAATESGFNVLGRQRMQGLLVISETALAILLLVGGGLLIHSFAKLSRVAPGFDPANVLTFAVHSSQVHAPGTKPTPAGPSTDDMLARFRSLPGVRAAGYAELLPFVRFRSGVRLRRTPDMPTGPPAAPPAGSQLSPESPDTRIVSRDFLTAMGIRVVEGRGFGPADTDGRPKVLLINRTLARTGLLGPHPIGTQVYAAGKAPWEIIGIVEDVRQYGLDQAPDPQIFIDARQLPSGNPNPYFAVRVDGNPAAFAPTIRETVKELSPHGVVDNIATMDQLVSNSLSRPRLYAVLLGLFACVAAALAVIGIYGVMAYSVAQRTREIGIRVALGAERSEVMRLVFGQSLLLTTAGIALGIAGAVPLTRSLDRMLFGLSPLDPATFIGVSVLFAAVAAAASYVPAHRATKVDPIVALRLD